MKAPILYRISSVLLLLFAVGHTLGFRQSDPTWGVDTLLGSMRSIHFDVQGFTRTYWDLFVAAGFSVGVFYLFAAVLAWQLGGLPAETFGGHARHCVGFRSLLCRHHGCELEIPLCPSYRFFNRDYCVFDCGGVALSEDKLKIDADRAAGIIIPSKPMPTNVSVPDEDADSHKASDLDPGPAPETAIAAEPEAPSDSTNTWDPSIPEPDPKKKPS
jgi:hypothetical protein